MKSTVLSSSIIISIAQTSNSHPHARHFLEQNPRKFTGAVDDDDADYDDNETSFAGEGALDKSLKVVSTLISPIQKQKKQMVVRTH